MVAQADDAFRSALLLPTACQRAAGAALDRLRPGDSCSRISVPGRLRSFSSTKRRSRIEDCSLSCVSVATRGAAHTVDACADFRRADVRFAVYDLASGEGSGCSGLKPLLLRSEQEL